MTLREDSLSSGYLINLVYRGVVQYSQYKYLKSGSYGRQPMQPYQKMTLKGLTQLRLSFSMLNSSG